MKNMPLDIQWLAEIKHEFKNKYEFEAVRFFINTKAVDEDALLNWFKNSGRPFFGWMRYKNLGFGNIELKEFLPNPSDFVCNKIIEDFFSNLIDKENSHFTLTYYNNSSVISFYSLKEVKKDLFYLIKNGYFKLNLLDQNLKDERRIYNIGCFMADSVKEMLTTGYVSLEYV